MFSNDHFRDRDQWAAQIQENSARTAFAWGTVESRGWGEAIGEESILFDVTYVEMPMVSYGFYLHGGPVDGRFPRCSGGVYQWMQDADDNYIGALVFTTVATADPIMTAVSLNPEVEFGIDPNYQITHCFTFSGLAYKGMLA